MKSCYVDVPHRVIADVSPTPEPNVLEVNRINVPVEHRGKRLGSAMLQRLCDAADAEGKTLILTPLASGGLSGPKLIAWYKRYGFVWHGVGRMKREPR